MHFVIAYEDPSLRKGKIHLILEKCWKKYYLLLIGSTSSMACTINVWDHNL
jgi:hypothetical protein